ncbi:hypothetical protein [Noviherbaspirillum autotrophicum]|uniref:hypothetical protein n=1 Tax=Noviherbaspirillum autotrophicum TaxID=709839 RepID=UPI000A3DCD1B|nr:hypothetical protein [Noviherbaspirillum autotrophicum]
MAIGYRRHARDRVFFVNGFFSIAVKAMQRLSPGLLMRVHSSLANLALFPVAQVKARALLTVLVRQKIERFIRNAGASPASCRIDR